MNKTIEIEIKLINKNASIPFKKHDNDIGFDLSSCEKVKLLSKEVTLVNTGLAINLPYGVGGFVLPRSGLSTKHKITLINSPGLIDPGYTGELLIPLINLSDFDYQVDIEDRIAQLVLINVQNANFKIVDKLPISDRSNKGFGSTG